MRATSGPGGDPAQVSPVSSPSTLVDGRYLLERELGRGAMGRVFRARDTGLDRVVALKFIDPEHARTPSAAALFQREAMALARLRSDHVIQVYAFGMHEGSPFFVMEYVEGADLEVIIESFRKTGQVVPLHRAATILLQAASGLAAVHEGGIVHRDIKPSNVLVEAGSGRPVLIDFGLAQRPQGDSNAPHSAAGTPLYMAPEQWIAKEASDTSSATDVYGMGATAFELFTGAPPYVANTAEHLMHMHHSFDIPRPSARNPALAALDAVIARAMAKAPHDRYPDAGAFRQALAEALPRLGDHDAAPETAAPSTLPSARPDVQTALIVDDDDSFRAFARRAMSIAFEGRPMHILEASSGEAALALAREQMPDLMVLDFDMPGLDGLQTLSHLRALPQGARVRVLVVTGEVARVGRWQFDVMGVVDFVAKPVQLRELARQFAAMAAPPR